MYEVDDISFGSFLSSGGSSDVWISDDWETVLFVNYPIEKLYLHRFQQETGCILMPNMKMIDDRFITADYLPNDIYDILSYEDIDYDEFADYLLDMNRHIYNGNRKPRVPKKLLPFNQTLLDGIRFMKFVYETEREWWKLDARCANFRADRFGKIFWFDPIFRFS